MINELRKKNELLIKKFKLEKNKDLEAKHNVIATLLSNDDCFFKIDINTALSILNDLKYSKEQSIKIYKDLISIDKFVKNKTEKED